MCRVRLGRRRGPEPQERRVREHEHATRRLGQRQQRVGVAREAAHAPDPGGHARVVPERVACELAGAGLVHLWHAAWPCLRLLAEHHDGGQRVLMQKGDVTHVRRLRSELPPASALGTRVETRVRLLLGLLEPLGQEVVRDADANHLCGLGA